MEGKKKKLPSASRANVIRVNPSEDPASLQPVLGQTLDDFPREFAPKSIRSNSSAELSKKPTRFRGVPFVGLSLPGALSTRPGTATREIQLLGGSPLPLPRAASYFFRGFRDVERGNAGSTAPGDNNNGSAERKKRTVVRKIPRI